MGKLMYGAGVNDADYVVVVWETVGYVDGSINKRKCGFVLSTGYGEYA